MHFSRDHSYAYLSILLLLLNINISSAYPVEASQEPNASLKAAMHEGDEAYRRFDNVTALAAYERALSVDSTNYPALWKATRAHADVGFAGKGKEQEQNYRTAEKLARRCVALHPDSAESHFVLAMAVGRVALKVGGKKKIELSKEIKAEAERTLALDPCHDGAMHVIARWHYELGNLSWVLKSFAKVLYGGVPPSGGNEEARRWLEKAIACDPRSPLHHLWLGKTLLELKETDLARKSLEECLRLPPVYWDDEANKREAERLLQKINKG